MSPATPKCIFWYFIIYWKLSSNLLAWVVENHRSVRMSCLKVIIPMIKAAHMHFVGDNEPIWLFIRDEENPSGRLIFKDWKGHRFPIYSFWLLGNDIYCLNAFKSSPGKGIGWSQHTRRDGKNDEKLIDSGKRKSSASRLFWVVNQSESWNAIRQGYDNLYLKTEKGLRVLCRFTALKMTCEYLIRSIRTELMLFFARQWEIRKATCYVPNIEKTKLMPEKATSS